MKAPHETELWPISATALLQYLGVRESESLVRRMQSVLAHWSRRANRADEAHWPSTELFYDCLANERTQLASHVRTDPAERAEFEHAVAVLERARVVLQEPLDQMWEDTRGPHNAEFIALPAVASFAEAEARDLVFKINPAREYRPRVTRPCARIGFRALYHRADILSIDQIRTRRQWQLDLRQVDAEAEPLFYLRNDVDLTSFYAHAATRPYVLGPATDITPGELEAALHTLHVRAKEIAAEASAIHQQHREDRDKTDPTLLHRGFLLELIRLMHADATACIDLKFEALDLALELGWAESVGSRLDASKQLREMIVLAGQTYTRTAVDGTTLRPAPRAMVSRERFVALPHLHKAMHIVESFLTLHRANRVPREIRASSPIEQHHRAA